MRDIIKVNKKEYTIEMEKVKNREYIDEDVIADNYYLVYENEEIAGGFGTNKSGYLTGLFSLKKGYGSTLFDIRLKEAIKDKSEEVEELEIFCIGDFLKDFYTKFNFKIKEVIKWDDEYAPAGWNYIEKGRPDLYNLTLKLS